MFYQLFLAFAWAFGCVAGGILVDTCCAQKQVGGVSYTLVEKGFDTTRYGCISNCMYEKDDQPGSRFCFAYGDMEVVCGDKKERKGGDSICDEALEKLLNYTNRSGPLELRCCNEENKGEYTSCTDLASCSKICGGNVSCMKPVSSLHHLDQCDIVKNGRKPNGVTPIVITSKDYCLSLPTPLKCPNNWRDNHCACCKYPTEYNNKDKCQNQCRCKATCDWFRRAKVCAPRIAGCCGCADFACACKKLCNPDPGLCPTHGPSPSPSPDPSVEPSVPTVATAPPVDCDNAAEDCSLCAQDNYRTSCAVQCKCRCTCKAITDCTYPGAPNPWSTCWRDYAECCECDSTNSDAPRYKDICPYICSSDDDTDTTDNLHHQIASTVTPIPNEKCGLEPGPN